MTQPCRTRFRIGRTIPPAAAPIFFRDILAGLKGLMRPEKEIARFTSELKDYFGMEHCFLVSSGKAALTLILLALKELHPERDEVLIPAFTCYSVPSAITRAGLKVTLCDIAPSSLDFDYDKLNDTLSEGPIESQPKVSRLLAMVPTHLFGLPSDVERLRAKVSDRKVTIIEDAAQAMGSEWKGRKLGTLGDVSFFSLGRGKAFSTVEGGIILTSRHDLASAIKRKIARLPYCRIGDMGILLLKALSMAIFTNPYLFWLPKSLPFLRLGETIYDPEFRVMRMSGFQAAMAEGWKTKLEALKRQRAELTRKWVSMEGVVPSDHFVSRNGVRTDFIRFPVRVKDAARREAILSYSEANGLGVMPSYPDSVDGIPELRGALISKDGSPAAKELAESLLTLPLHRFVKPSDVTKISRLFLNDSP